MPEKEHIKYYIAEEFTIRLNKRTNRLTIKIHDPNFDMPALIHDIANSITTRDIQKYTDKKECALKFFKEGFGLNLVDYYDHGGSE